MQQEDAGEREFGWYAHPPAGYTPEDDDAESPRPVEGTHIRMMAEWSVTMPLWDADGPLPEDPDYLQRELGISPKLSADLAAWGVAWETNGDPGEHSRQGRHLFARLQAEISQGFTVSLRL